MDTKIENAQLYQETVPVFVKFLSNLYAIMEKGIEFAGDSKNGVSEQQLLEGKLAPDMFHFIKQIGYAYFTALECVTNLTGKEAPKFTYDEKSLKELQESVRRMVEFLNTIKAEDISFSEGKDIKTFLHETKTFPRDVYVRELSVPNFFFHVTTAYDIFRHLGVPLKKSDYLGVQ